MAHESRILAEFTSDLRYENIPTPVVTIAKACIIDTIGVALFGSLLPWSRSVDDYVRHIGGSGSSTVLSPAFRQVSAPAAALANGTFAHAFEFDNLRQPSIGVHPGATALIGAIASAEEVGASGEDLITALVAGCECMFRIALAAKSTSEKLGFHAPGLTGVFGSAIAVSKILRLSSKQTLGAMGIAGSLCSGLLAFAKAGNGGMVKRLHMGRAAEGGVTAGNLAARGFEGPDVILEGHFGFLDVYARDADCSLLVDRLGDRWETLTICFKSFPCHVTAQSSVQALQQLQREHKFKPQDVSKIIVEISDKALSHHADPEPQDVATAQYSLPFSVALTLFRDPADPQAFLDGPKQDPAIIDLSHRVELRPFGEGIPKQNSLACRLQVILSSGEVLTIAKLDFEGTTTSPISKDRLESKFLKLTGCISESSRSTLLARLNDVEKCQLSKLFESIS
jgi:2-methylcitrate dehydratase PrpD